MVQHHTTTKTSTNRQSTARTFSTVTGCTRQLRGCSILLFCTRDLAAKCSCESGPKLPQKTRRKPSQDQETWYSKTSPNQGLVLFHLLMEVYEKIWKKIAKTLRPGRDIEALRWSAFAFLVWETPQCLPECAQFSPTKIWRICITRKQLTRGLTPKWACNNFGGARKAFYIGVYESEWFTPRNG